MSIFHGDKDQTIPISMGRQLAVMYPAMITFHAVSGADHNTVLPGSRAQIFAAMQE